MLVAASLSVAALGQRSRGGMGGMGGMGMGGRKVDTTTATATTAGAHTDGLTDPGSELRPKNVLLFMTDDLDFPWPEAPAVAGGADFDWALAAELMPNFARIRRDGTVFSQAYAASPKCAPARFGLMTGRHASRGEHAQSHKLSTAERTGISVPSSKIAGDRDNAMTLAATLAALAPVATVQAGKWHLIDEELAGGAGIWGNYSAVEDAVRAAGFEVPAAVYGTNMDHSLGFSHNPEWTVAGSLAAAKDAVDGGRGFFLYHAPTAPHNPSVAAPLSDPDAAFETPAGRLDELPSTGLADPADAMPARSTVADRVDAFLDRIGAAGQAANRDKLLGAVWVDDELGALLDNLERWGALDDTLVIVTTDHGMDAKDSLYEGGSRVALMMRHPGTVEAGAEVATPVSHLDVAPTVLDALGHGAAAAGYPLDGASLWPLAAPAATEPLGGRPCLVTEIDLDRAVLCGGRYKLISRGGSLELTNNYPGSADREQLYDLAEDPTEQSNLMVCTNDACDPAPEYADVAAGLRGYISCHDTNTKPGQRAGGCNLAPHQAAAAAAVEAHAARARRSVVTIRGRVIE